LQSVSSTPHRLTNFPTPPKKNRIVSSALQKRRPWGWQPKEKAGMLRIPSFFISSVRAQASLARPSEIKKAGLSTGFSL